ncbi:unnamed protein product [Porites evermanni]|uniref:Uncharacterized protein n=1 Tax=Porites evermanni TaxID=104178 RepID=A0ABN8SL39_9CNID|nr:unnamed protein product [Porites evermanni]
MSSSLVTVHNQNENVYIQHRPNGERSWIGLNDRSVEGSFVWANKEISSFRFWAPQQPNDWKNEDCVHTLGARHGYTWNDVPCHNCYNYTCFKDLDECTTGSHSCDANSVCQNNAGSYTCSCNAGYTGDGKTCNDIDECSSNAHSCGVNAMCNNTLGSYACACKAGYSGDGRTCTDIDECASGTDDCHSSRALCTNTVGSFNCSCNSSYIGDGRTCNLPSECQNYGSLHSGTRRTSYGYGYYCDNGLGPGWFRFQGSAGTRMATSCPSYRRCGTYGSGWLSGGHPSVADGQVTRTVYFNDGYCYSYSKRIKVRNCGSYYVYYLSGTPTCNLRYCGTN